MAGFPDPFEWNVTKSGKLLIYRGGVLVTTISADKAIPILARLGEDQDANQQVLARVTGNYRRGNERLAGKKQR